ncbi:MAG TPA: ABC transporter substrate-binding protein [Candidatus Binatus sp.]|nr:ABC transporter substrate-binding protein [Candidatus Binatus sp.]
MRLHHVFLIIGLVALLFATTSFSQERRKIRISNATLSYSALALVAAREWKLFQEQGLDVEVILMRSAAAAAALVSGDLDYQSGIGPASISATLSGVDSRALWSSTNRITYWLMAKSEVKNVTELRRKKIGVSGLGGTSHVALNLALEKRGIGSKDYVAVSVPGGNLVQSLDSGFVDAAALNPPTMFFAQRRGFHRVLDIGSLVEMASGGLTAMTRTIRNRPDEVKRIIRALQLGKKAMLVSRDRTLGLITGVLKMDKETAADTFKVVETSFNDTGIPTPEGIGNIIKAIKAEGRFADRKIAFEEVADPRFAIEVAKELGYK